MYRTVYGNNVPGNERRAVGDASIRSGDGAASRKGCVVDGQMAKANNKRVRPPPLPVSSLPYYPSKTTPAFLGTNYFPHQTGLNLRGSSITGGHS